MVNEKEFFEAIRKGDYCNLPKELYDLFILAVTNQDKRVLTVRKTERPIMIEEMVYRYNLKGLKLNIEVDVKDSWSMFNRSYTLTMDVIPFLSNLSLFYQVPAEELRNKYMIVEKERRKNSKDPRNREFIIYKRKIGKEK